MKNTLYYGDNLQNLREYIADESVDLVYLDPPFNSKRTYNVLFKNESGQDSEAQIAAFDDTWHWNAAAEETYYKLVTEAPDHVSKMIGAMREFIGTNQMMAYLVMMAIRLVELHRVLKPIGSLYLHCDPTASHYLKVVLDTIFGVENFRSEIIWRRTGSHNSAKRFGPIHDIILFYTKTNQYTFNIVKRPYMKEHVERRFKKDETGRHKFSTGGNILTGSGIRHGESGKEWRGFNPTAKSRHWAIPGYLAEKMSDAFKRLGVLEKLETLYKADLIEIKEGTEWPTPVRYLRPTDGQPLQDIWAYQPYTGNTVFETSDGIDEDVAWLGTTNPERLGYPTQKPIALLERIIKASSNPGDIVLDPFCGCGTAIVASEKLGRKWAGVDITHLSIALQKYRLQEAFPDAKFEVKGEPETIGAARFLAEQDRFQFEWWALSLVRARPGKATSGSKKGKKGADKGIDGVITFIDTAKGKPKRVLVQVKSGKVSSRDIRDLVGTVEREKAAIGVFITLEKPTKPMTQEAVSAGFYESPGWQKKYPKIQILTIKELLGDASIQMPPAWGTFKQAQREEREGPTQGQLEI